LKLHLFYLHWQHPGWIQRLSEPGTKVLGPRSIDYWGRGGGFHCIQTLKTECQGYISPRTYGCGFVHFRDFIVEEDIIVVRNQGTRYRVESLCLRKTLDSWLHLA
jgi:hypothetical protein